MEIKIDEQEVKKLCKQRIDEILKEVDGELVFWDSKELTRRTCMSWNFIKEKFFHDSRFEKYKVGTKWYFPAKTTKEFLLTWIHEQAKY